MKQATTPLRASHINTGTSIEPSEVHAEPVRGREYSHPRLQVERAENGSTAIGGLALAIRLAAVLKLPQAIDENLSLLKSHRPFHESDHVLTHAYNLFVGATAIEDIADLQHDEAVRRMLGASRIPDPTTAGDFLRRFDEDAVAALDRAFACQDIFDVCDREGLYFAMVSPQQQNFEKLAESVPEGQWRPFRAQPQEPGSSKKRRRGKNLRRRCARARGKRDLVLRRQWLAEIDYQPARSAKAYRLIIRRQKIEKSEQGEFFDLWRYRFVLTNLPSSTSTEEAVRLTYRRCDQENVIEQLQNGVAAMRMPTGSFLANSAFLACARIAFNLKAWLAMLVLPNEVLRWEWKRFRKAFVYLAACVVLGARQVTVRLLGSDRYTGLVEKGLLELRT